MLALSAVMLSTSTYAWFTMNKEVEMTGLNMSATAGEGMEISLAGVSSSKALTFYDVNASSAHPSDENTEEGWKSAVIVGQYYKDIGKLRPASSVDGKNLFDATDAGNGGTTASKFKELTLGTDMAKVEQNTTLNDSSDTIEITSDGDIGYYADIPVHLRTNKAAGTETEGSIYYKMKIKSSDNSANELYKSVRIAFIPGSANSSSDANIFGVNDEYYTSGQAVNSVSGKGNVTVKKESVVDTDDMPTGKGSDSGLKIPYAAQNEKYGHLDFTVRIWIDGESKFCSDATSGQSWNIDLAFSLGEFDDNTQSTT